MRLPFEDLGLLPNVMRLDLSPCRISVTVALQDHSSRIGSVQRLPGSIVVFRKEDRLAALGYLKMGNPPRGNSAHGPTAEALNCLICG